MNKKKYASILLTATIIFSVAFAVSSVHADWVTPTGNPPTDNTPAPVNTGFFGQAKQSWLSVMNFFGGVRIASREVRATKFCLQDPTDYTNGHLEAWGTADGSTALPFSLDDSHCVEFPSFFGAGGSSDYTPQGSTSVTVGGVTAGTNLGMTPITLQALLDRILYPYTSPGIVLTASPTTHIYEKGSSVGVVLTATATPRSNPVTNVAILKNGAMINSTGFPTLTYGETITDNATYQATASDAAGSGGGPTTVNSNSITYTFVYPMYGGYGPAGMTAGAITAAVGTTMQKFVQQQSDVAVHTSPTDQYYYFAYPASYPDLDQIRDNNNFETKGDYIIRTVTMTSLPGSPTYKVYEFDHATTQNNFTNTYKF